MWRLRRRWQRIDSLGNRPKDSRSEWVTDESVKNVKRCYTRYAVGGNEDTEGTGRAQTGASTRCTLSNPPPIPRVLNRVLFNRSIRKPHLEHEHCRSVKVSRKRRRYSKTHWQFRAHFVHRWRQQDESLKTYPKKGEETEVSMASEVKWARWGLLE